MQLNRVIKNLKLKDDRGVLVSGVRIGSPSDEADVYRGYVIKKVDGQQVMDLDQFKVLYQTAKELPTKGRMLELVYKDALIFALLKEE